MVVVKLSGLHFCHAVEACTGLIMCWVQMCSVTGYFMKGVLWMSRVLYEEMLW